MKNHFVCFGNSNTHSYCADRGDLFNKDERWACLLQKLLGKDYLVIEEGLSDRLAALAPPFL